MLFFFFKQKTAYEMRISDWSSDVCSSDLVHADLVGPPGLEVDVEQRGVPERLDRLVVRDAVTSAGDDRELVGAGGVPVDRRVDGAAHRVGEIGRASCRASVCQYV